MKLNLCQVVLHKNGVLSSFYTRFLGCRSAVKDLTIFNFVWRYAERIFFVILPTIHKKSS